MTIKYKKLARTIRKYRSPISVLVCCLMLLSGAALRDLKDRMEVMAAPIVGPWIIQEQVPVPVPLNCRTEKCRILAYIVEKFGDDANDAITLVSKCENHAFNPNAINHNSNGTTDHSIFQINSIHSKRFGEAFKTDWKANIDVAYQIFKEQGWSPWACSHVLGVRSFWQ